MIFFSTLPLLLKSAIEFLFLILIAALLVLSLFCVCFILLIRFKSRSSRHLQNFNSLWTVRFLFVIFIAFWALTEAIRLPSFRHIYLNPLFPNLTPPQQANFCKLHVVLSLGIFEPGFLVILLFLLDVSIKKTTPKGFFSVFYVFASCLPLFLLQVYVLFLDDSKVRFPKFFCRSWFLFDDSVVLCAYPFLSTILFGIFGVIYILSFLVSFWKVVSHVINKALKFRIFTLAITILVCLPLQILLMGLSDVWTPDKPTHDVFTLSVFLTTFTCAVVAEGILVIKPISDSLNAICGRVEEKPLPEISQGGESSLAPPPAEDGDIAMDFSGCVYEADRVIRPYLKISGCKYLKQPDFRETLRCINCFLLWFNLTAIRYSLFLFLFLLFIIILLLKILFLFVLQSHRSKYSFSI